MAFLLLVFSLPFTKRSIMLGGLPATATKLLYLVVLAALALTIASGSARLRWTGAFAALLVYFAATLGSVLIVGNLSVAAPRIASQVYLLSFPVLAYALIDDRNDLRRLLRTWLAGTAMTAGIGAVTVILFAAGVDRAAIDYALHGLNTFSPGAYPRLESTFTHPAMLCNYLTVSLVILMICLRLAWIGRAAGYTLLGAILPTAAFTMNRAWAAFPRCWACGCSSRCAIVRGRWPAPASHSQGWPRLASSRWRW